MSGLMHKVKDALQGGHKDENAKLEHDGLQGEHGSQSGVHDTPVSGSVAHGDSVSPTNPGVLNSTKRGIHGDRDTGTSGTGLSNQELTGQTGTEGAGSGIGSGTGSGYDSTSRGTGLGSGNNAGPQYTGISERDTGLVGSGIDTTGRGTTKDESSLNAGSGSSYNPNDRSNAGLSGQDVLTSSGSNTRDTGIGGTGSGYDSNSRLDRDNTTTGSGLGSDDGLIAGGSIPQTGSGYDKNTRGADFTSGGTGSGLTGSNSGVGSGYDSNTRDTGLTGSGTGSGLTGSGSGYGSNTRDTGLTGGSGLTGSGSGYDSNTRDTGLTGGDSGLGSGTGSSSTGLTGKAEQYVEGSEKHHRGDGHPEDIVHPGHHYTETAKALDPHLN